MTRGFCPSRASLHICSGQHKPCHQLLFTAVLACCAHNVHRLCRKSSICYQVSQQVDLHQVQPFSVAAAQGVSSCCRSTCCAFPVDARDLHNVGAPAALDSTHVITQANAGLHAVQLQICSLCLVLLLLLLLRPSHPPKHLGALEQDVLQEVGCAVVRIVLEPAARVDPDAHCGCLRVGVGLGSNPQTIWQSGHLQPRTSGDTNPDYYPKAPAVELLCPCIVIVLSTEEDASAQVNPAAG